MVPFLLSQLALFITLPVLIFGPIAGVLVDRWHKKRVMVLCDTLRMGCAFLLPLVFISTKNIYLVFAIVFFMFLLALFFNTARSAIIPNLVSRRRLLAANSIINFVGRGATFLGMVLGGLIIDWSIWQGIFRVAGWVVAFVLDGITFGVSAGMLYLMKVKLKERIGGKEHLRPQGLLLIIKDGLIKMNRELKEAVHSILKEKNLTFAIGTIFLMILAGSVIYVLAIPVIQKELLWGTRGLGILAAVGAIGLLSGAYLVGIFGHQYDLKLLILFCFIIISAGLFIFPFITKFFLFTILCLICGAAISPIFIGQDTLIHRYANEEVRGKIFSLRDWVLNLTFVIGALLVGTLSTFIPRTVLFILFGGIMLILSLLAWISIARARDYAKGTTTAPSN